MNILKNITALFFFAVYISNAAFASIVINTTRVIYPQDEKEVTVKINNLGKSPVLIQNWIDNGDVNADPDSIQVPFILTPPMNRVDPGKGQTLRISYTGTSLPSDRETLFWLNVLEAPPVVVDSVNPNRMQVAFRTRIKFFYRPTGLKTDLQTSAQSLKWVIDKGSLQVRNDSPYFVSLLGVRVTHNGKEEQTKAGMMISPYKDSAVSFSSGATFSTGDKLSYDYINDWGAVKTVDTHL